MATNGDPNPDDPSDTGQSDGGDGGGGDGGPTTELSIEDVRFMRAVRDINENPADYPRTEKGTKPASARAIKEATTLSKNQIDYRLGTTTKERGFDELGYLVIHDPPMTDTGYGPRSAELTEKGAERLEEGLQSYGLEETESRADPEVMEKLEDIGARLDSIEQRMDAMEEDVADVVSSVNNLEGRLSRIENTQMGAVDEQQAARLRTVIDAMPAFYQAFQLLGMDVRQIQDADELDETQTRELVENVQETLNQ